MTGDSHRVACARVRGKVSEKCPEISEWRRRAVAADSALREWITRALGRGSGGDGEERDGVSVGVGVGVGHGCVSVSVSVSVALAAAPVRGWPFLVGRGDGGEGGDDAGAGHAGAAVPEARRGSSGGLRARKRGGGEGAPREREERQTTGQLCGSHPRDGRIETNLGAASCPSSPPHAGPRSYCTTTDSP